MEKPILFLDSIESVKYGQTIKTKFLHSYIIIVQDGTACVGEFYGMNRAEEVQINDKNFPNLKKPSLFARSKPFPVKIYHLLHGYGFFKMENLVAKDRETKEELYKFTLEEVRVFPQICPDWITTLIKHLKDREIFEEFGKPIIDLKVLSDWVEEVSSYMLGDLASAAKSLPKTDDVVVIPPRKNLSEEQKAFRKKFMDNVGARFYEYGIEVIFEDLHP